MELAVILGVAFLGGLIYMIRTWGAPMCNCRTQMAELRKQFEAYQDEVNSRIASLEGQIVAHRKDLHALKGAQVNYRVRYDPDHTRTW